MVLLAHSFFLHRDAKQLERLKPYPPLTTLLAAGLLREAGLPVGLFDATFADGPAAFQARLAGLAPSVLLLIEDNFNFLTKMCTENRRADALAMIGAARARGWTVAVNSPDAIDNPRIYLDAGASGVLVGEGEFAAVEFARAAADGAELTRVSGLILDDGTGGLSRTTPRLGRPRLDSLPLPAWDLVDAGAYREAWVARHGYFSWNAASSRGCPYACNWCAKPTFGRRYDQRSPASVAEELRRLKREVRPDHVWFADDIFGMTPDWIAAFAEEVAGRDAVIPFMMQSRVNLITQPVAAALRAAGAQEVWLGVESGSQRILDAMDKGAHVDTARVATRNLKRHGIRACWFLQLGYPPEDWDDILATRDLVREEAPDDIGVSVAYPLPGTAFHDRLAAELGAHRNWRNTGDLAMLFEGTFDTAFYRMVRDALHSDVTLRRVDESGWTELAARAHSHRTGGAAIRRRA
ncbi:MAG TPA: radical SAM protein [Croceibacterium sp.]|nr:radical SAM protein [Croceibacterium sp.]